MIRKLSKMLEERRMELNKLLKRKHLKKDVRNQLEGAINELNIVLRMLKRLREIENMDYFEEFKLVKIEDNGGILSKIFGKRALTNGKGNSEDINQESY